MGGRHFRETRRAAAGSWRNERTKVKYEKPHVKEEKLKQYKTWLNLNILAVIRRHSSEFELRQGLWPEESEETVRENGERRQESDEEEGNTALASPYSSPQPEVLAVAGEGRRTKKKVEGGCE